jgi:aminoglycoside phosphotransferase (APT) family kinase protein
LPQPWVAEVNVTEELARTLIETQFPGLTPVRLKAYGEGWDNSAFLVNDELIFRFPRRQLAAPLLLAECRLLPLIARHVSLPVPQPIYRGSAANGYPWEFAGYRRLPGRTASDAVLTDKERAGVAEPLGRLLSELHSIPIAEAARRGAEGDTIGRLDFVKRLPLARKMLARFGPDLPCDVRRLETLLDAAPPTYLSRRDAVVHGDLYGRHLLVDDDRSLCGVIDWGDCHIGDRAIDLLPVFTLLPPAARGCFFEAYGPVGETTLRVAAARALYHTLNVLNYAQDISDGSLEEESLRSLVHLAA